MTKYFTPKRNREYEIYVFRQAKQESNEGITGYHTRLRQLAATCEFESVEREIKTQIVQNCLSHKLRMKALENPDLTLSQLLEAGKAMEISKTQAANIEHNKKAFKILVNNKNRFHRARISQPNHANDIKRGGGRMQSKSRNEQQSRSGDQSCLNIVVRNFPILAERRPVLHIALRVTTAESLDISKQFAIQRAMRQ